MSKKLIICKLDTPLTLVQSAMRVPQAEPVNFAKAFIEANPDENVDVVMFGHAAKSIEVGFNGTIRTVPYFGNPRTVSDEFVDESAILVIWQGRHVLVNSMPKSPQQLGAHPALMDPYSAGDYDRLCAVKLWQVMMYNLISSSVVPDKMRKYFLVTDLRLPLIDLNAVDSVSVPKKLPKDIHLICQAHYADEYNKWQAKYGNCMTYQEMNIADYCYEFKSATYLPMHALPLWSHSEFYKDFHEKHRTSIFQTQSLRYVDDYRKKKLAEAMDFVNGHCTLHGRFLPAERGIVVATFPKYSETLLNNLIDNSSNPGECFFDSAQILSDHLISLVITDERYARFGLVPNRFVEALAVGSVPLATDDVLQYCDDTVKQINAKLNVNPRNTFIGKSENINYENVVEFHDYAGKLRDNGELVTVINESRDILKKQLLDSLNKFANKF